MESGMFWAGMMVGVLLGWLVCAWGTRLHIYELHQWTLEALEQMHADQRAEYDRRFREMR